MKHSARISTVSILCSLCMCAAGSAYGASSVRSLGGAGTYSGTASASSASGTSSSVGAARAGSVRITPTSAKATTATSTTISSGNSSAARGAATSRLSVGKYLNKVVASNSNKLGANVSSSTSSNTNISNDVMKIVEQLEGIEKRVDGLQDDVANIKMPTAGDDFIDIDEDKNEIFINIENLAAALSKDLGMDEEKLKNILLNLDDETIAVIVERLGDKLVIDAGQIEDGTIGKEKLSQDVQNKLIAVENTNLENVLTKDSLNGYTGLANMAIPQPTDKCMAASGLCVLSVDTDGKLEWVNVTPGPSEQI